MKTEKQIRAGMKQLEAQEKNAGLPSAAKIKAREAIMVLKWVLE